MSDQIALTDLIAELAEAEKEFTQAGIHLSLDPDDWEEQNRYDALEMYVESLREEIVRIQGI